MHSIPTALVEPNHSITFGLPETVWKILYDQKNALKYVKIDLICVKNLKSQQPRTADVKYF